jgi:hypothetical protein
MGGLLVSFGDALAGQGLAQPGVLVGHWSTLLLTEAGKVFVVRDR